jgi:arylsulfatase A-like enzyme
MAFSLLTFLLIAAHPHYKSVVLSNKMDSGKPNILFIFTDDQRYNTIHALGGNEVLTPNLDSLVASGTTFTHAYNMGAWHGAVCVASRTMFVTGLSVWKAQRMEKKLADLVAVNGLWSQQLREAGYETYMSGKWHVRTDVNSVFDHVIHERPGMPNQTPQGYNRPLSPQDTLWKAWDKKFEGFWKGGKHWSEVLADDAVNYLHQAAKKEKPFFMYLAFNAPHDPRQSPKEFIDKYPLDKITVPASYLDEYPYKEEMGAGIDLRDEQLAPFPRTKYAVKKHIQEYYASISHMDEQIGKILDALAASGKLNNTYIFFTSDHGLSVGHHGLMGKQNMFDHSVRVPLIVAGPGIPKGEKRDQQVYLQDIMATTYQLAGIQKPAYVYFNSMLPMIKDKEAKTVYPEIYGGYMNLQRMVRTDQYKLIVYPSGPKILLFDLKKDPQEMRDVSGYADYQLTLVEMKARLMRQQKELDDTLDLTKILKQHEKLRNTTRKK